MNEEEMPEMLAAYLVSILEGVEPEPSKEDLEMAIELEDQLLKEEHNV
jgi:hypothetical protein